ncbi:MAG: Hsp20/alpha crystallin family protein [Sulfurimonas sp.]|uniref:Hsp20/alpha crystallin family protein n=1 Tax=Sulfurimonas sp. TaxID=2022749 RepID=UPI0026175932|nr:Hsp20/alpha crystallin family protein [Sulfurimonas sp.]MDD3344658.1 Hsp20/alpha crystallin family protein [Sulfurospirillaceae bacterium]MDD3477063.1 Hsp20/alpha crystallin family protein [Sulfurimonas sp.]
MDIVKTAKEMGSSVEKGVETITNKLVNTFDNLASHLPFSNIAKKEDSSFHLEVDLPGVTKEDIDIKVEDGILAISAIRKYKNELTRDDYYICESSFGKFERRYALPESVDTSKVDAKFVDGRLIVELQKTKKAKPRVISIK